LKVVVKYLVRHVFCQKIVETVRKISMCVGSSIAHMVGALDFGMETAKMGQMLENLPTDSWIW